MEGLRKKIENAINCASAENGSNTPDFILAEYLSDCLIAFDKAVNCREKWWGRENKFETNLEMCDIGEQDSPEP